MKSVFPFVFEFFEKSRREKFRHPNWLGVKKIFGSDSAQISCVKSLGHKDFKFWVSSKSETKKKIFSKGPDLWRFSDFQSLDFLKNIKGSPLWKKKIFLSPILMKLKIWNPYGLGISHMKFERNRSRKFFWHIPWPRVKISGETCDEEAVFGVYGKPKIIIFIWKPILGT